MHIKFEISNAPVKNVTEIDFLSKDLEKVSLKDSPVQEEKDKPKDNVNGEVQDVEVEPTQSLPKDHLKDLILGDVFKGVTTQSKLHDICRHVAF